MNFSWLTQGITYFESLLSNYNLSYHAEHNPHPHIDCPILREEALDYDRVKRLFACFFISARNAIYARPVQFVTQNNWNDASARLIQLLHRLAIQPREAEQAQHLLDELTRIPEAQLEVLQNEADYRILLGNHLLSEYQFSVLSPQTSHDNQYVRDHALGQIWSPEAVQAQFQHLLNSQVVPANMLLSRFSVQDFTEVSPQREEATGERPGTPDPRRQGFVPIPSSSPGDSWYSSTAGTSGSLVFPEMHHSGETLSESSQYNPSTPILPITIDTLVLNSEYFVYQGSLRLSNLPIIFAYRETLALPRLPIIQPYHPNDNARPDVFHEDIPHGLLNISVALHLPLNQIKIPPTIQDYLEGQGFQLGQMDVFICVQDNPWEEQAERLLRVHPYVQGDWADNDPLSSNLVQVAIGNFQGHFTALNRYRVETHDGVFSPENMAILGNLTPEMTHVLYSICEHPRTGRVALTLHILTNDLFQYYLTEILRMRSPAETIPTWPWFLQQLELLERQVDESTQRAISALLVLAGIRELMLFSTLGSIEMPDYQLRPDPTRVLSQALRFSDVTLLNQGLNLLFSGTHSAGGLNTTVDQAASEAGSRFVSMVLGEEYLGIIRPSVYPRFRRLVQSLVYELKMGLLQDFKQQRGLLLEIEELDYQNSENTWLYFHPNAVALRTISHNPRILRQYKNGILLKEIVSIWASIRHYPAESKKNYLNLLCQQLYEIQRAYNIARFYQTFFGSDYREEAEWLASDCHFNLSNAQIAWLKVESNLERVLAEWIKQSQTNAVPCPKQSQAALAMFEDIRNFILDQPIYNILENPFLLTIHTDMLEKVKGFIQIIVIANRLIYPTAFTHTDDFKPDADSCGPGAETRLLDMANTLPDKEIIHITPANATQFFWQATQPHIEAWIKIAYGEGVSEENIFSVLDHKIRSYLKTKAEIQPELGLSLNLINPKTQQDVLSEFIYALLDGYGINPVKTVPNLVLEAEELETCSISPSSPPSSPRFFRP